MSTLNLPAISRADVLAEAKRQQARVPIGSLFLGSFPEWERFCGSASQEQMRQAYEALTSNKSSDDVPARSPWAPSGVCERTRVAAPRAEESASSRFDDENDEDPLARGRQVAAMSEQVLTVVRCLGHLKQLGITLDVWPRIEFRRPAPYYRVDEGKRGLAQHLEPATFRILLHAELFDRDLVYVLAHEVWHCSDFAAEHHRTMERAVLEERAVEFGMKALESYV